jgi:class 3 adenylate cyclase/Flp pilus assembly protein TadD
MAVDLHKVELPPETWDGFDYTAIPAAILFADLENSVLLSSTLNPADYQLLLNSCQVAMHDLVADLRESNLPVAEYYIAGDQLCIFFYDPDDVKRNWLLRGPEAVTGADREQLLEERRLGEEDLAFSCLRAAIKLKNLWMVTDFNMERIEHRREPIGLGIGMHTGSVYYCNRPDGRRRIEGYAVNLAKRIEGYSRKGKYSHIMLSQDAHLKISGSIRKHTMLKQRLYFFAHEVGLEMLKGITRSQSVYELKFYSRIGLNPPPEVIDQYETSFELDNTNIWAYYQLFEHYFYHSVSPERVRDLTSRALMAYPHDEKIMLDLSRFFDNEGNTGMAIKYAHKAIELNPDFDLALEHLAVLYNSIDQWDKALRYLREAVSLSPVSAVNHLNLGLSLFQSGIIDEACRHLLEAFRLYPEYLNNAGVISVLADFKARGQLPEKLAEHLAEQRVELPDIEPGNLA